MHNYLEKDSLDWTILHDISYHPSQSLSSACTFSYGAQKVSTIFLFLTTFVPMLWIISSTFHVRRRILKVETAAESAGAGAAHNQLTRIFFKGSVKGSSSSCPGTRTKNMEKSS
jgi:hypothetical protein